MLFVVRTEDVLSAQYDSNQVCPQKQAAPLREIALVSDGAV